MKIQHNLQAMNISRQLDIATGRKLKCIELLSSGYQINRASDNSAGLSISEKMRAQIRALNRASANAQDGTSLLQTVDGALNEVHSILQRMRELSVAAGNDTNVSLDRNAIRLELDELAKEIDRIGDNTEFNSKKLLDGSCSSSGPSQGITLQIGANSNQSMVISIDKISSTALGVDSLSVSGNMSASESIKLCDDAIKTVSATRSELGAAQNRLGHVIANLDNTAENLQSSESRIRDTDIAKAMVEYAKASILEQVGLAMLSQASKNAVSILVLLR